MSGHSSRRRLAFTLIELLVVVAIIALLISILLPSLNMARRQARTILCLNNLRTQAQACHFYAEDHKGWNVGGIVNYVANDSTSPELMTYPMSILKYTGQYDGKIEYTMWGTNPVLLNDICGRIPQFQCPDHPKPQHKFDYAASAFAIPFTVANINDDEAGGGWAGDAWQGEFPPDYRGAFKLSQFPKEAQAAKLIYVSEIHESLPNGAEELRFHTFFYTSQLPLGLYPRIASDLRHPGGVDAMFFDGHARTMKHTLMDAGYGSSLGVRLRWFTLVPPGYE